MNSGATIFDDRETVEFLRDHPHLLAIADAVHATQRRKARPWASPLRIGLAAAVLAAAAIGAYVLATNTGRKSIAIPQSGFVAPTPVANAAAADALLPFNVVLPSNATPTNLTVSADAQALNGQFDTTPNGSYVLDEEQSNLTVADLQRLDEFWHPDATHSVVVVNGVPVLIQAWSDGSVEAQWFRADGASHVLSWAEGPNTEQGQASGQTFGEQQALSVASDIIGQGG